MRKLSFMILTAFCLLSCIKYETSKELMDEDIKRITVENFDYFIEKPAFFLIKAINISEQLELPEQDRKVIIYKNKEQNSFYVTIDNYDISFQTNNMQLSEQGSSWTMEFNETPVSESLICNLTPLCKLYKGRQRKVMFKNIGDNKYSVTLLDDLVIYRSAFPINRKIEKLKLEIKVDDANKVLYFDINARIKEDNDFYYNLSSENLTQKYDKTENQFNGLFIFEPYHKNNLLNKSIMSFDNNSEYKVEVK